MCADIVSRGRFDFDLDSILSRLVVGRILHPKRATLDFARTLIEANPAKIATKRQNDFKRLISETLVTTDGEVACRRVYALDVVQIAEEESCDGFYAVATSLEGDVADVVGVNEGRWEIEECFRIMKSEFKSRLVYLSRDECIEAHFLTCFIALFVYRLMEKCLGGMYTCRDIVEGLRSMVFPEVPGKGYVPAYTRTDFADAVHEVFGFRTDYEIVTNSTMRKIFVKPRRRADYSLRLGGPGYKPSCLPAVLQRHLLESVKDGEYHLCMELSQVISDCLVGDRC